MSKIGVLGDLHITNRSPIRRKDDYFQAIKNKLIQAFEFFKSEGCEAVFQVGDFFDAPTTANRVIAEIMSLVDSNWDLKNNPIYCCYGQHDISGHSKSTLPNSPLTVLESAPTPVVKILNEEATILNSKNFIPIYAYGSSFGEEVPVPKDSTAFNILVTHRMLGNRPLYPGQPLEDPRKFLQAYPQYNLVLCGDYHYAFTDQLKDQLIVNTGCIVRKNLSDVKLGHQPSVCTINLKTLEVKTLQLRVEAVDTIFDLSTEEKVIDNDALMKFVKNLQQHSENKERISWKSLIPQVIQKKGFEKKVGEIIDNTIESIQEGKK